MSGATEAPSHRPPGHARRSVGTLADAAIAIVLLSLVVLPVAAWIGSGSQPEDPERERAYAPPPEGRAPPLRELPLFTPGSPAGETLRLHGVQTSGDITVDIVEDVARPLLGTAGGRELRGLFEDFVDLELPVAREPDDVDYPFRSPPLERLLDRHLPRPLDPRAIEQANDLAAVLILAGSAPDEGGLPSFFSAGQVALALLYRARETGGCEAQLNLAWLLSASLNPFDDHVAAEFERAANACPRDPTPLWALGQFQSQRAYLDDWGDRPGQVLPRAERLRRPFATFRALQRRFPASAAGWAGEADAELRLGYQQQPVAPFTARDRFARALRLYRRAEALDPSAGTTTGVARALAGLGKPRMAAAAQRRALRKAPDSGPLQARLLDYLERAHEFRRASAVARRATASSEFSSGLALFASAPQGLVAADERLRAEDAQGPLSIGTDSLEAVSLDVGPQTGGADVGLSDLSFIPAWRKVYGITGIHRWCPEWAWRRDELLAGRVESALAGFPASFTDVRPRESDSFNCGGISATGVPQLAAVAELERAGPEAAFARMDAGDYSFDSTDRPRLAKLQDARQELWRFGGRLDRAAIAAREWARAMPGDAVAALRAGEVAFLRRRWLEASDAFSSAARRAREGPQVWTLDEARALLGQGVALSRQGRFGESLYALRSADEVATRLRSLLLQQAEENFDAQVQAEEVAVVSYHARAQLGDAYRALRRDAAAADAYRAAAERRDQLPPASAEEGFRPQVLENQLALAELRVGRPRAALAAATRAVSRDRASGVALQTQASAEQGLGRSEAAIRHYRAAVVADATLYPSANDLGVILAEEGRNEEAADALRRAVGAREDYALGWFNLGVVLGRMGPAHLVSSQGALAKAIRLDPDFRGRERTPTFDDRRYVTGLDLSRPLPPDWQFADTQRVTAGAAVGLAGALLLALALPRALTGQMPGADVAGTWLGALERSLERVPRPGLIASPVWAGAITVLVLVWPLVGEPRAGPTEIAVLVAGVLALVGLVLRARSWAARREGVHIRQETWMPGLLLGVGAAAFGLGWAPLPVVRTERPAPRVHWAAPLAAGAIACVLLALGALLEVPLSRAVGTSALIMTASMLTPIKPLDGGVLAQGGGLVATVPLLGLVLLLVIGLV
jgi:cellulose synthase operon protein C